MGLRLALSADDFGLLLKASGQSVYTWHRQVSTAEFVELNHFYRLTDATGRAAALVGQRVAKADALPPAREQVHDYHAVELLPIAPGLRRCETSMTVNR